MRRTIARHAKSAAFLATFTALGLAACSASTPGDTAADSGAMADASQAPATMATAPAGMASGPGTEFLTSAMQGDNSEIKLGRLAADQGGSDAVKAIGRTLVADHTAHKQTLATLAQQMNVPVTDAATRQVDATYARLQGLSGAQFDRTFLTSAVDDHRKDIAEYQQEATSNDPAAVTRMAQTTIPILQQHLERAQQALAR